MKEWDMDNLNYADSNSNDEELDQGLIDDDKEYILNVKRE